MAIEVISCSAIELAFGKSCGSAEVPVHCTSFTFHPRTQVLTLHAALFGKRRSFHVYCCWSWRILPGHAWNW